MSILDKALLSLNREFFLHLEHHLCKTFPNSPDNDIQWLGCDGIDTPDVNYELTKGKLKHTKEVLTKAWIGTSGQHRYQMLIKLGPTAIKRLLNDESLIDAIPCAETMDWVTVDMANKSIEIRLK